MLFSGLFLATIMCSLIVEQREASRIDLRLQAEWLDGPSERSGESVRHTREVLVQRIKQDPPDPSQTEIEEEALDSIRQLEFLQGLVDHDVNKKDKKKDKDDDDDDDEDDAGIKEDKLNGILLQHSFNGKGKDRNLKKDKGMKLLETKHHKIKKIITRVDSGEDEDEDEDEESKPTRMSLGVEVRKRSARGALRPKRRSHGKKANSIKIVNDYIDDDDDDDDYDDYDDDYDDEEMKVVKVKTGSTKRKNKKKPTILPVAVPMPARKSKKRKKQKPTVVIPPEIFSALENKKEKKAKPTVQIIEVEKKGGEAAGGAAPAAEAAPPAGGAPPPAGGAAPPAGGAAPPGGAPPPPGGAPPPPPPGK